mmetsp:Transcript_8409/g.16996  ORF Transcript_8409/g.16996 Transcript_8409/m.16996 type:complete len:427 (+) Transcript_8409:114-1394(+)
MPLNTKFALLSLLLVVTPTSNALWRRDATTVVGSCASKTPSIFTPKSLRLSRIGRRSEQSFGSDLAASGANTDLSCCRECSHCLSYAISKCRGGAIFSSSVDGGLGGDGSAAVKTTSKIVELLPLNAWKGIFQVILTSINVVCWLVPLRAKNFSENKSLLSLANAFSGGVFLSLAFAHLIPECIHGFGELESTHNEVLPYMAVLFGYLLIFFVEKVMFDADGLLHDMEGGSKVESSPADDRESNSSSPEPSPERSTPPPPIPMEDLPSHDNHSSRGAVILLGALAVHSILEMAALGLANSFNDSALLSLSIALHQPAESIALLVAFLKSGMPKHQIGQFLSIFSLMGPIGVILGMAVKEVAPPIVDALMLATVAGTFIYVGATEVIPEEFEDQDNKWKKFGSLIVGIVSIFFITQYTAGLEGVAHA